jgi:hypothetical protein
VAAHDCGGKRTRAMTNVSNPILFNTSQAAEFLRLSRRTLEGLRVRGGGPRYRKIGRVFYERADLFAWLDAAARNSTGAGGGHS